MRKNEVESKFTEKIMSFSSKVQKVADVPWLKAIQNGMIATTAPVIIGSLFLILSILAQPGLSVSGKAVLPFLTPYADQLNVVNSMTLGFIGLYAAFGVAKSYGEILKVDTTQSGVLGLVTFFFVTYNGATDGKLDVTYFGTNGLFVAMITSVLAVKVYSIFIKKNFVIRLPESVPPKVGETFASLIPMAVIIFVAWFIRTILDFNLAEWINTALEPVLHASDTVLGYGLITLIVIVLWSVGLNGPGMLGGIIGPITTSNLTANSAAKIAGEALPHIWTNALQFSFIWVGSVYPVVIWYMLSKNKGKKALGFAATPALIFNIIEPTMFGAPVALNPILMIPFIFNGVVGCLIGYIAVLIGFVARPYAEVPWPTPAFISGIAITGDWKILIVQFLVLVIGLITYYPFIRSDIKNSEEIALENE